MSHQFFWDEIKTLGTAACPPYHLAIVIGGLSAELTLKTVNSILCVVQAMLHLAC